MQNFYPSEIYVDQSVRNLPATQRILKKFPHLPVYEVSDKSEIKFPQNHTRAKKQLYLAAYKGNPIKSCQGMGDYVCCQYFTIALVSDCHLECTYCILQDYLKNNPIITIYTNTEEIFSKIKEKVARQPNRLFRIGTGELSDSLGLDHIHEFSKDCVEFAASLPNVLIELKTKTNNIQNLFNLNHQKRTVISWSVNPQKYIEKEELKCNSLEERLHAARLCADAGYSIAFHFDPLLHHENWKEEYTNLVQILSERFSPQELSWVSIGSLRFTKELKKISMDRFPKSKIMTQEMFPSKDGKIRYFRPIREEMYRTVKELIEKNLKHVPRYLCMETKAVWQNVFGETPKSNSQVENHIVQNFEILKEKSFTV